MSEFDIILDNSQQNLVQIPAYILDFCNLKMLYLEGNHLQLLPDHFFLKLKKLQWLDLRNNKLLAIPETIAHHQCLENLLLSNNKIETLPLELGFVPKLKVLQVADNPILFPSRKILAKGTKVICNYLRDEYDKLSLMKNREDEKMEELYNLPVNNVSTSEFFIDYGPSKLAKTNNQQQKIMHKIYKDESKISLQSSYDNNISKNIKQTLLRENWINKLKTLLNEQERILQQERNITALNEWRWRKQRELPKNAILKPPFATDFDCSTEDLGEEIDQIIMKSRQSQKPTNFNIEQVINELVSQLNDVKSSYKTVKSPRTEMEESGEQIKLIMDIHKKLSQLKLTNKTTNLL